MRTRSLLAALPLVLSGCGLLLDLDPPDSRFAVDASRSDASVRDGSIGDAAARDADVRDAAARDADVRDADEPIGLCEERNDGDECDPTSAVRRICLAGMCVRSRCGDGFVDELLDEDCDDGNEVSGDGCEPDTCTVSCGEDDDCAEGTECVSFQCEANVCVRRPIGAMGCALSTPGIMGSCVDGLCVPESCGNRMLQPGEVCDDGNRTPGDGCSPDCQPECTGDADCDDGVGCNGVERCIALPEGAASCSPGVAPSLAACELCDPIRGMVRLRDEDMDGFPCGVDCNDLVASVNPGQAEIAGNGVDDDCDGATDEAITMVACRRDVDGDGAFGPTLATVADPAECPMGTTAAAPGARVDCDDGDPDVFPGQTAFFTTSRCEGGVTPPGPCWDYDCDGREELRWPRPDACTSLLDDCSAGQGWDLTSGILVPGCGETGGWTRCVDIGIACLPQPLSGGRTQACR